jgi:DNA-binding CsgD family transcriptional regulator
MLQCLVPRMNTRERHELVFRAEARLHRRLLALHAATETESLWHAVQGLFRDALPCTRVTLFLGHLGMREARLVFTDPPVADPDGWYDARARVNPFSPYIDAHRGVKSYHFRDVLPSHWKESEFYRRFAVPEGWDKGFSLLFWEGSAMKAMTSVYRAPEHDEFSADELALLRHLQPLVGTAIDRVRKLAGERLARQGLEEFNRNMPIGVLVLDWDLRLVFANHEAFRQCVEWNYGADAPRALNPRDCFALPGALATACAQLKSRMADPGLRAGAVPPPEVVAPPTLGGRRATVSVLGAAAGLVAPPRFLAIFEVTSAAGGDRAANAPAGRLQQLRSLTPREQEIALLVCDGLRNAEIAQRLGRSVLTVKTQLNSVFRKLGVSTRTQLVAHLR